MAFLSDLYQSTLAAKIGYYEVVFGLAMSAGVNIGNQDILIHLI